MKIIIDIPKEFEIDFKNDKFEECFERVITDIENMRTLLSGNYEAETLEMLRKAFKEVNGVIGEYNPKLIIDNQEM